MCPYFFSALLSSSNHSFTAALNLSLLNFMFIT
jgi:hypothetical protein